MARGNSMRWGRALLRFLDFALSLVALATLSRAFVGASYYGYSSMLGSRAATYATLMTYTGMVVGLFFLLFMELFRFFPRPTPHLFEQLIDLLLAAMLVVAGIVLVVSDYVSNCSVYGYMLRCNHMKTAVVFTFLASFSYFVTFLLDCCESFMGSRRHNGSDLDEAGHAVDYHAESTPTGISTPKDTSNRTFYHLSVEFVFFFLEMIPSQVSSHRKLFCCSLIAYIALRTAGVSYQNTTGGQTVQVVVSSSAMSFARIINFLAFVYAFAFLVFIEWLRLCIQPVHYCERVMDMVLFVSLATASLFLLLSGVTLHCHGRFNHFVRCGSIYLAVAASVLSTLAFLGVTMIGSREDGPRQNPDDRNPETYEQQSTPRTGATPVPIVTEQPA
ncbi:putative Marvel domain-containing protein [Plasmopara halstedii]